MLWLLALTVAGAAELHFELVTEDGISESWTKEPSDTFADKFGPVKPDKKKTVLYLVNAPPSNFLATEGGYNVELTLCREWVKKSKKDRDCSTEKLVAPSEADGPMTETTRVKGTDKFQYTLKVWYTGEPPIPTPKVEPAMPEAEPEPPPANVEIGE